MDQHGEEPGSRHDGAGPTDPDSDADTDTGADADTDTDADTDADADCDADSGQRLTSADGASRRAGRANPSRVAAARG
jgi:hypothetical protein